MLARGRAEGIALMPLTAHGAALSFWAAGFCLPLFLVLRVLLGEQAPTPRLMAAELVGFAVGWAGYALATLPLAAKLGRDVFWPRFLATWNWISLVQYGVIVLLSLLVGFLPGWLGQGVQLAGLGYALWLQGFGTRLALQVPRRHSYGFVLLDLMLGLLISSIVTGVGR